VKRRASFPFLGHRHCSIVPCSIVPCSFVPFLTHVIFRFMSVNNMTFTNGAGAGGMRVERLLQEKPDAEAMAALDIKPKKEKMINKSKFDAKEQGKISSFSTTSRAGDTRAGKMDFKVRAEEEAPPFPQWGRRSLSIN